MLKAKNLRLKYPNGERKIFDNLNIIEIKDKEKVLLLGPSDPVRAHCLCFKWHRSKSN